MIYRENTRDLLANYNSLSLAIYKLIEGQEKSWGCFQVQKEDNFYTLYIPSLPSFKLYQNPKSIIYRGYWRRDNTLPKPTDTKNFPPDLWIKKKQKKVINNKSVSQKKTESKSKDFIEQSQTNTEIERVLKSTETSQKQRIYEVAYRYHQLSEVRVINRLIAEFIKEKIIASIVNVPAGEVFPSVMTVAES